MITKRRIFMTASIFTSLVYILWRLFFTLPLNYGLIALIAGIALFGSELVGMIEAFYHYRNINADNYVSKPEINDKMYPDIDVFIATHSEDVKLLFKTVNGAVNMDYPDKSKVHIYLCDDNDRTEMKELADKMNVGYFGLSDNKEAKAGNLNNAIGKTDSPLIVTLDADMIPRKNFLIDTVPYFYLPVMKEEDGKWVKRKSEEIDKNYVIGFIQTPQSFYNTDLFQFNFFAEDNIPNEQDYFFKEVNIGRNHTNSPIYAGSNTVLSRTALEDAGGIKVGTITEDFATGIEIQSKGYTCFAIPEVLAHGLAPTDFKSLIKQRQRWGRGCVQSLRSKKFIFGKMKLKTKLSYISSFLYWWTFIRRLIYIISPVLFTVFGIIVVDTSLIELFMIWLPQYILYNRTIKIISGNVRDQKWSNIVDTILFPYMILPIIAETFGIKHINFFVTPKEKVYSKSVQLRYAIPHIILAAGTAIGLYISLMNMIVNRNLANIVIVFWLSVNLYFLSMAILFMLGRINYRDEDRLYAEVDVEISTEHEDFKGLTTDISEGGMAVVLDIPHFIQTDKDVDLIARYKDYEAKMKVRLVHVAPRGEQWKYSLVISEITDENKKQYLNIVFDREHTLPMVIQSSILTDIRDAISGKIFRKNVSQRKQPRIPVDNDLFTKDGNKVHVIDYNYEYLLVEGTLLDLDRDITLVTPNNIEINCNLVTTNLKKETMLYEIDSWEEVAGQPEFIKALFKK